MLWLSFLNRILSVFSSRTTMSTDPFVEFFNSPASMSTTTFLNHFKNLVLLSPLPPTAVLRRFMVKTVSLNKHTATTSQHEFLSIEIYDTDLHHSHLVFLERTISDSELPLDLDSTNPYHHFIHKFLRSLPVTTSPLASSRPTVHEDIPLLQVPTTSSESSESLVSSGSMTPSLLDITSLASIRAMHQSMDSISGSKQAGDQFIVGRHPSHVYGGGQIMRQLQPSNLTFFQLIILAEIVHNHDPLYQLFKRQCYWYSNTIYQTIAQSFPCVIGLGEPDDPTNQLHESDLRIPFDAYLPPSAGRWKGMLVMVVSQDVVQNVKQTFEEKYSKFLAETEEQWDRGHGENLENASLRARISELEARLDQQVNMSSS